MKVFQWILVPNNTVDSTLQRGIQYDTIRHDTTPMIQYYLLDILEEYIVAQQCYLLNTVNLVPIIISFSQTEQRF